MAITEICKQIIGDSSSDDVVISANKNEIMLNMWSLILKFSQSLKVQVAANGLRAAAQFLELVDLNDFQCLSADFSPQVSEMIQKGLKHKSAKVGWNACIALGKLINNVSLLKCEVLANSVFC